MSDGERTWTRLRPKTTAENDLPGLRAEVHDPLWTLGRQWQVGDLQGEDGGSPVRVDCWVEQDRVTRYDLGGGPTAYDPDEIPLETVVESEAVVTGGGRPDMGTAVEAGLHFLRLLDREGHYVDGSSPAATDFDQSYRLDESAYEAGVEVPESESARRFELVVDGRALDGYDVYHALVSAVSNIATADEQAAVAWPDASALPVPGGSVDAAYRRAATAYVDWYRDLFDEPADHDAWDESRLEYDFDVATGDGATETVFTAREYPGGHLDWASFEADPTASLSSDSAGSSPDGSAGSGSDSDDSAAGSPTIAAGVTEDDIARHASVQYDPEPDSVSTRQGETVIGRPDVSRMPTPVTFPGMPASRWWELEDGSVNLFDADVGPGELGKEVMLDFALTYGNDWFSLPLETRVGTTNRVTALAVVDTFGAMEVATPSLTAANRPPSGADTGDATADGSDTSRWKLFTDDLGPNHDEPGLFVPPTLSESFESDPLERVVFARDELSNLAWAIEERVLDPYGIRIDVEEYTDPTLRIAGLQSDEDPAEEYVELENPGDEPLAVGDWRLVVERSTESEPQREQFAFTLGETEGDVTVEAGSTLRVIPHVGSDTGDELYWNWDASGNESLLTDATKVVLQNGRRWPVGYRDLRAGPGRGGLPAYRLASDVADHWYPLKPRQTGGGGFDETDTVFALARLVDADVGTLPTPKGRILREYVPDPDASSETVTTIHDEELTRAGVEVTRSYQLSRWIDGGTHMWSARRSTTGYGQGNSGLRYDYLERPDDE